MNLIDAALTTICLPIDSQPEPFDPAPSPEALTIERDTRTHIGQTFYRLLPAFDAAVMVELYLEDMTAAEVARCQHKTEDHINHIRRKALKVLRSDVDIRALLIPTATPSIT
jgi:DNA-directed RNA polymerase specialized sigma24 family protein